MPNKEDDKTVDILLVYCFGAEAQLLAKGYFQKVVDILLIYCGWVEEQILAKADIIRYLIYCTYIVSRRRCTYSPRRMWVRR